MGLIPCDTQEEYPMAPITAMRNALGFYLNQLHLSNHLDQGISEGGSGVPIDREKYEISAAFWDKHINVEDGE